jgi:hypothetical protein
MAQREKEAATQKRHPTEACPICNQPMEEVFNNEDEVVGLQCNNEGCGHYTSL